MVMEAEEGGVIIVGQAEIDTQPPFRSVKEAVMLFGEKVLVAEIYANKLKEMKVQAGESGKSQSKIAVLTSELEETKQSLQMTKEEGNIMSCNIKVLKEELEKAKRDLQQFKVKESQKQRFEPDIEDLKFIEKTTEIGFMSQDEKPAAEEFQNKRFVKFASSPSLPRVVNKEEMTGKSVSVKKVKRKSSISIVGWLFPKKMISP